MISSQRLVPNLDCETNKIKIKTKNPTRFYCKEGTKLE
jgi:hypothetical protein